MQTAIPVRVTTGATTNLTNLGQAGSMAAVLRGLNVTNTAAYAIFVKFWWGAQGAVPTVGTTVPDMVVTCPAAATSGGGTFLSMPAPLVKNGQLWMWVTKLAADSDTTATVAGDGLITVFL